MTTIRLLSKKWAVPIMYHLYRQNLGFSELKREVGMRISSTMLSRALDELQESNLVEKRVISTSPIRVEYSLLPIGSDFCALVESLEVFGKKYLLKGSP
jgi:DNA-binding HxlR family transcriptional regulator